MTTKRDLALAYSPGVAVPVQAIYEGDDIPEELEKWIEINAERVIGLPVCEEQMEPLAGAEDRKTELGF